MTRPQIKPRYVLWVVILFFSVVGFCISVFFFYFLIFLVPVGFVIIVVGELRHWYRKMSWLRFLCFSWLFLAVPTFGIMPLMLASRLHRELPLGNSLVIFTGITLSSVYDFFIPTPDLFLVDHPFPPLTNGQLYVLGFAILALSMVPLFGLIKLQRVGRPSPQALDSAHLAAGRMISNAVPTPTWLSKRTSPP